MPLFIFYFFGNNNACEVTKLMRTLEVKMALKIINFVSKGKEISDLGRNVFDRGHFW
jgi:hypothetical protein